ncbi:hypothetical protein [Nostoc sp. PCC 9305]|uniref:hypothetical protein n=1 Tax=Nostoc sp. PCC 9305 TaxID=296636 RepID=UPI0039C6590F
MATSILHGIIGNNNELRTVFKQIEKLAPLVREIGWRCFIPILKTATNGCRNLQVVFLSTYIKTAAIGSRN